MQALADRIRATEARFGISRALLCSKACRGPGLVGELAARTLTRQARSPWCSRPDRRLVSGKLRPPTAAKRPSLSTRGGALVRKPTRQEQRLIGAIAAPASERSLWPMAWNGSRAGVGRRHNPAAAVFPRMPGRVGGGVAVPPRDVEIGSTTEGLPVSPSMGRFGAGGGSAARHW